MKGSIAGDVRIVLKDNSYTRGLARSVRKSSPFYAVQAPRKMRHELGYYLDPHTYRNFDGERGLDVEDWEVWSLRDQLHGDRDVYTDDEVNLEIVDPLRGFACVVPLARNRKTGKYHSRWEAERKERFTQTIQVDPSLVDENVQPGVVIEYEGKSYVITDRTRPRFRSALYFVRPGKQHLQNLTLEEQKDLGLYYPEDEIYQLAMEKHAEWKRAALEEAEGGNQNIDALTRHSYSNETTMILPYFKVHFDEARRELGAAKRKPEEASPVINSLDFSRRYTEMTSQNLFKKILTNSRLLCNGGWPEIMKESVSHGAPKRVTTSGELWVPPNMLFTLPQHQEVRQDGDALIFDLYCEWERVVPDD
jgi:hypothetical protein